MSGENNNYSIINNDYYLSNYIAYLQRDRSIKHLLISILISYRNEWGERMDELVAGATPGHLLCGGWADGGRWVNIGSVFSVRPVFVQPVFVQLFSSNPIRLD